MSPLRSIAAMKSCLLVATACLLLLTGCAAPQSVKAIPESITNSEWAEEFRSLLKPGEAGGVSGEARRIEANLGVK